MTTMEQLLEVLPEAAKQFFETMCPLPFEAIGRRADGTPEKNGYEVLAVISLSGGFKGSVSIAVHKKLGEEIAKTLLGLTTVDNESDIFDTVGEFANIVVGGAKNLAQSKGLSFDISCPTIIAGDHVKTTPPKDGEQAIMDFNSNGSPFSLLITQIK